MLLPLKIIAYADDTMVFFKNQNGFQLIQTTITKYMTTSNASLNYSKTKALSLSGQIQTTWQQFLNTEAISSWHDKTATDPLIYLGYPILSSKLQQTNYASSLIAKIKQYCLLHSHRNLSLRGRATILNSLLYSKLWHIMRIFTLTKTQLKTIQQIGASFINNNVKVTRFLFNTLTLPRNKGVLNLIDPVIQANALQWRWLRPLLDPTQQQPQFMVSLPYSKYTLNHFLSSQVYPMYHWSLLFPTCRPTNSSDML